MVDWRVPRLMLMWEQKREVLDELRALRPSAVKGRLIGGCNIRVEGINFRQSTRCRCRCIERKNMYGMAPKIVERVLVILYHTV
jgi:hypothetical protein